MKGQGGQKKLTLTLVKRKKNKKNNNSCMWDKASVLKITTQACFNCE